MRPACRFLSRYDRSATHLKESHIWLTTGSVSLLLLYRTLQIRSHIYIRSVSLFVLFPCLPHSQVPWGYDYSRWYHQYVRFPREALRTASALDEYTLIDYGAWLSAPSSVCERMKIFKLAETETDSNEESILLNPAHLLYAGEAPRYVTPENERLCQQFFEWTSDTGVMGGIAVTLALEKKGFKLYVDIPRS